jgi:hypothetical protein
VYVCVCVCVRVLPSGSVAKLIEFLCLYRWLAF